MLKKNCNLGKRLVPKVDVESLTELQLMIICAEINSSFNPGACKVEAKLCNVWYTSSTILVRNPCMVYISS